MDRGYLRVFFLAMLLSLGLFFWIGAPLWGKPRLIMDTDAKNEIDDQFTITYLILANYFDVQGFTAEHFLKKGSMEASYREIKKVLALLSRSDIPVFRGASQPLKKRGEPVESEAMEFIVEEAMRNESRRLILLCTGALTNVVSALIKEPAIASKIEVYWLAGMNWPRGGAVFNNKNDMLAAQLLFASNIPLTLIPAIGVSDRIKLSLRDKEKVKGKGKIGDYLWQLFMRWHFKPWPLWDMAALAAAQTLEWTETITVSRPKVRGDGTYDHEHAEGKMKVVKKVNARAIKADFFRLLSALP